MSERTADTTGHTAGKAEDSADRRAPTVDEAKARLETFRSSVSTMTPEQYKTHVAAAASAGY